MAGDLSPWPESVLEPAGITIEVSKPSADGTPWAGMQGWVQLASKVLLTKDCQEADGWGSVLMAEWLEEDGAMHRIYPDPAGSGGLIALCVRPGGDDRSYLRQRLTVTGSRQVQGRSLQYHVYWHEGEDGALDRAFDMFAGFAREGAA